MLLHFKYLNRTTFANKVLRDKAFDIAKDSKYNWFQYGIASMVYKFFDKRTSGSGIKNENVCNLELAEELSKPIVKNFKKRKLNSPFIDNICVEDLAYMQLISKFNKLIRFLLCVIDIYRKYAWIIPVKDKKGISITNAFRKF